MPWIWFWAGKFAENIDEHSNWVLLTVRCCGIGHKNCLPFASDAWKMKRLCAAIGSTAECPVQMFTWIRKHKTLFVLSLSIQLANRPSPLGWQQQAVSSLFGICLHAVSSCCNFYVSSCCCCCYCWRRLLFVFIRDKVLSHCLPIALSAFQPRPPCDDYMFAFVVYWQEMQLIKLTWAGNLRTGSSASCALFKLFKFAAFIEVRLLSLPLSLCAKACIFMMYILGADSLTNYQLCLPAANLFLACFVINALWLGFAAAATVVSTHNLLYASLSHSLSPSLSLCRCPILFAQFQRNAYLPCDNRRRSCGSATLAP